MLDVIIAGAGPAGAMAALVLARAGARVLVVDRETFPRDKLCGDTLNPGARSLIASLDLGGGPLDTAPRLSGMVVTGAGTRVVARYGGGTAGVALSRRVFDAWLLDRAVEAGARFEGGLTVRGPLVDSRRGAPIVRGLTMSRRGAASSLMRVPALLTIAADGRRSAVARALNLAVHPPSPRRWAFGAYATGVAETTDLGEMHIATGRYVGIAPLAGGIVNVCVVTGPRPQGTNPMEVIRNALARNRQLQRRFRRASFISEVRVLGPMAVEARAAGVAGALLAGDAAGFVDPMTGDGLHLAMRGAVLAARAGLRALESGDFDAAVRQLEEGRRLEILPKVRFNRALRRLVESRIAVGTAAWGARLAPGAVRWAVRYAGDAA